VAIECGLQSHRDHRNYDRHHNRLDEEFDDERPFRHPLAATRREIEMNRPTREREAHTMKAAAEVVCERGFGRVVDKVAIDAAGKQSYSNQNDRRRQ
jgi:hypothetical protein